jgi:hypothetical protein
LASNYTGWQQARRGIKCPLPGTFGHAGRPDPPSRATLVIAGGLIGNKNGTGEVSPNGVYRSASMGDDGIAMTATGRMSGNAGSGSFRRADGCVGRWSARRV